MRRLILMLILGFCKLSVSFGQQKPHYTQYFQNYAVLNPAATGVNNGITIKAGYRNQWVGFENAPKTSYLTVGSSNFGNGYAKYTRLGIIDPDNRTEAGDYESSDKHHAYGVVLLNDNSGTLKRTTANLTYAYHIKVNDKANFSAGVGAGINQWVLNAQDLHFKEEGDAVVKDYGTLNKITPDVNAGIYFYSQLFLEEPLCSR